MRGTDWNDDDPAPATRFLKDATRSIISSNDSPDVGFGASVNPYGGCEHGCVYWVARPNHEYLGFSAGLDFETRILVKQDAPELLRRELSAKKWRPKVIALSGATDPYQPIERRLELTRNRIHSMRGGRMNDPNFNSRMRGQGPFARQMRDLFDLGCRRAGLDRSKPHLSTEHFLGNVDKQQSLFV